MGKKQKKRYKQGKKEQVNALALNEMTINTKDLTKAIVEAYQIIEDKKNEQKIESNKNKNEEWKRIIGQKKYPEDEEWYLKIWHRVRNYLAVMWTILFFKEKNARDLIATMALMKLAVSGIFIICEWVLYALLVIIAFFMFMNGLDVIYNPLTAFVTLFFARVFRVASFEADKIGDSNLLIAIFSGCISFVAMIVAIIAIFVD